MKLALGTVQFGLNYGISNSSGRVPHDEAKAVLDFATRFGIDTLDTAITYGDSEVVLGRLGLQKWKVITKLPSVPYGCNNVYEWVIEQVKMSVARLGVTGLYGLLLHDPSQLLGVSGATLYAAMQDVKLQGLTKKIGISIYRPEELERLVDIFKLDIVQAPLNIFDQSLILTGWANMLHKEGVEVHSRSAFLQGLLLMPANLRPSQFQQWAEVWSEWDRWLDEIGLTPLDACTRYVCSFPEIDRVVVGVESVQQLDEIVKAPIGDLPSLPKFKPLKDKRLIDPVSWSQL